MPVTAVGPPAASYTFEGEEVAIPVEVRSATMVTAQYLVAWDAVQRLVDPTGLRAARLPGGRALAALSAVRYTDNDLGPYHELALAFVVEPHDAPPGWRPSAKAPVTYIHRLPVNQRFTCEVGRGLWGFPKWRCDIAYVERAGATTCAVVDHGELVVRLDARRGGVPLPPTEMAMTSYSLDDGGTLRRTAWTTRNERVRARPGGTAVTVGGGHALADELRSLGLPRRALATTATGHVTASFAAPEVVTR